VQPGRWSAIGEWPHRQPGPGAGRAADARIEWDGRTEQVVGADAERQGKTSQVVDGKTSLAGSRRERVERSMLAARQPAGASSPARYPVPAAVAGRADRATPRRRLPPWQTRLPQPVASGRRRRGRPVGDRAGADRYDGCCWRPGWTTATPRSPASSRCGAVGVPLPVLPRLGSPRPDPRGSRPWPAWRPPRLAAAAAAAHLKRRRHPAHQRTRRSRHRRP